MAARLIENNIAYQTLRNPNIALDKVALCALSKNQRAHQAWRYGELIDQANRVSGLLKQRGLRAGDKVVVLVPMSLAFYAIVLGVTQAGGVCVFLDPGAPRAQLNAACDAASPGFFFGIPKAHLLRIVSRAFRRIPCAIVVDEGWFGRGFREALRRTAPDASIAPVRPDEAAAIAYTTGSTGRPKPIKRSHGHIVRMLQYLDARRGMTPDDVQMAPWAAMLFDPLCHGRSAVIPAFPPGRIASANPAVLLEQMQSNGVTVLSGPPVMFERLCDHLEASEALLPVRFAFIGGAWVSHRLLARVADRMGLTGLAAAIYGSTEVEPVAVLTAAEAATAAPGPGLFAGYVHPELSLMIIRCHRGVITLGEGGWTDWAVGAGEWGEIVVAGPHVNVEEGDDPEAFALSKIVDPQGRIWHRMGDTGYLDAGGVLYLTGRLSDLIETERGTLFPYPIEAIARSVEGVKDAYLINHEGCPTVVIETIPGIRIADTLQAARNTLQIHGVDHVTWCKQLPRDHRHNSKVDPDALRRILNRRHP